MRKLQDGVLGLLKRINHRRGSKDVVREDICQADIDIFIFPKRGAKIRQERRGRLRLGYRQYLLFSGVYHARPQFLLPDTTTPPKCNVWGNLLGDRLVSYVARTQIR
uniref:Uncharacterized protein n=1 Tax=Rhodopseudomonas palustris (strain BisA53) TaxID=316055 RepID=Q07NR4_RHOP5